MQLFKANPENAACVKRLTTALAQLPSEGTLSKQALSEIAGKGFDIWGRHRHIYRKARDQAETDQGVVYGTVHGVGIKRLPRSEAHGIGALWRRHVGRGSKRHSTRIMTVVARGGNDMSETDRRVAIAEASQLGAIATVAGNAAANRIIDHVPERAEVATPVPKFNILKLFEKQV